MKSTGCLEFKKNYEQYDMSVEATGVQDASHAISHTQQLEQEIVHSSDFTL